MGEICYLQIALQILRLLPHCGFTQLRSSEPHTESSALKDREEGSLETVHSAPVRNQSTLDCEGTCKEAAKGLWLRQRGKDVGIG